MSFHLGHAEGDLGAWIFESHLEALDHAHELRESGVEDDEHLQSDHVTAGPAALLMVPFALWTFAHRWTVIERVAAAALASPDGRIVYADVLRAIGAAD